MRETAADVRPSYLPAGYRHIWTIIGIAAHGFGRTEDQAVAMYVRSPSGDDATTPLSVYSAQSGKSVELGATEGRPGDPVDLEIAGAVAIYHDGIWSLGPGNDQKPNDSIAIHWDTTLIHSLTIRTPGQVFGIRATKLDADRMELIKIARSLPLA